MQLARLNIKKWSIRDDVAARTPRRLNVFLPRFQHGQLLVCIYFHFYHDGGEGAMYGAAPGHQGLELYSIL